MKFDYCSARPIVPPVTSVYGTVAFVNSNIGDADNRQAQIIHSKDGWKGTPKSAVAKADFTGNPHEFELNLRENDCIIISEYKHSNRSDQEWIWGRVIERQSTEGAAADIDQNEWGWVPRHCITEIDDYTLPFSQIQWPPTPPPSPPQTRASSIPTTPIECIGMTSKNVEQQQYKVVNTNEWLNAINRPDACWNDSTRPFARSGANGFVLGKCASSVEETLESSKYRIGDGPRWFQSPLSQSTRRYLSLKILGRHKRYNWMRQWVVYEIESIADMSCSAPSPTASMEEQQGSLFHQADESECDPPVTATVFRRYSQFCMLYRYLSRQHPGIIVPELPCKYWTHTLNSAELDKRQQKLERWLGRIARHPVLGYSEGFESFLTAGACPVGCTESVEDDGARILEEAFRKLGLIDTVWSRTLMLTESAAVALRLTDPQPLNDYYETLSYSSDRDHQVRFYECVYHPEFNLPADDPEEAVEGLRMTWKQSRPIWYQIPDIITGDLDRARRSVDFIQHSGKQWENIHQLLSAYRIVLLNDEKRDYRRLSYALYRLVGRQHHSPQEPAGHLPVWCQSDEGSCGVCKQLTDATRSFANTLTAISNITLQYSEETVGGLLERLEELTGGLEQRSQFLLNLHEDGAALGRTLAATLRRPAAESKEIISPENNSNIEEFQSAGTPSHVFARLETLFNVSHAELTHWFHDERQREWLGLLRLWVDGEMKRYSQCLEVLRECAAAIDNIQLV